jgi:hypothetical protein
VNRRPVDPRNVATGDQLTDITTGETHAVTDVVVLAHRTDPDQRHARIVITTGTGRILTATSTTRTLYRGGVL